MKKQYQYLDTSPKNDVILFSQKRFCALGLGLQKYVFGQTSIWASVLDPTISTGWLLSLHSLQKMRLWISTETKCE